MLPKTNLIKLHTKIDTKFWDKIQMRPKANLIQLHTCHSRVSRDLKLAQMI